MTEERDPSLEQLEVMDAASRKVRSRGETGDAATEDEEAAVVLGVLQAVEATCGSRRHRHGGADGGRAEAMVSLRPVLSRLTNPSS